MPPTVSLLLSRCHLYCCIVAVLLLSQCCLHHHIVVVLSPQFCCCHHGVAFVVTLSQFHCCHCGVAFTSVTVSLLLLRCHLRIGRGFIIAITVSPSHWSQFHHCHRSIAFIVTLLWCHHHIVIVLLLPFCCCRCSVAFMSVAVSSLPSWCCFRHCIVAVLSSQLHCCGAFAVASLQFHHCRCSVTF